MPRLAGKRPSRFLWFLFTIDGPWNFVALKGVNGGALYGLCRLILSTFSFVWTQMAYSHFHYRIIPCKKESVDSENLRNYYCGNRMMLRKTFKGCQGSQDCQTISISVTILTRVSSATWIGVFLDLVQVGGGITTKVLGSATKLQLW